MAGKELNIPELEETWEKMVKETFETFAQEHLGYDPGRPGPPDCFGSGDNHTFCDFCRYQEEC